MAVENIAHTMIGYAIGKAGLEKQAPLAAAALVIGANLPDAEVIGSLFGANYLDSHRGITHGAAGILLLSVGLAAVLWTVGRFARGGTCWRSKLIPLWVLSLLGLASHDLLDYCNDYGLRPWLPFSGRRIYGDLLSIIDPWIWVIFGSALYLLTSSRGGRKRWMAAGSLLSLIAVLVSGPVQGVLCILTVPVALWLARRQRTRRFNPARAAFAAFLLYLGALAGVRAFVLGSVSALTAESKTGPILKIDVLPGRPASLLRWFVVMEEKEKYYAADINLGEGDSVPGLKIFDKNLDNRYYREALAREDIAAMARFARFPYVVVEPGPDASHTILLRDLRYARDRTEGWGTARATVLLPR